LYGLYQLYEKTVHPHLMYNNVLYLDVFSVYQVVGIQTTEKNQSKYNRE